MKVKSIKTISGNQVRVSLLNEEEIMVKDENKKVFIESLIFKRGNEKYDFYKMFISNKDLDKVKNFYYEANEVEFKDIDINNINKWFNEIVSDYDIIPLNYFNINEKMYSFSSIKDILNLKENLSDKELNAKIKEDIAFGIARKVDNDDGIESIEFNTITNTLDMVKDGLFIDFINQLETYQ